MPSSRNPVDELCLSFWRRNVTLHKEICSVVLVTMVFHWTATDEVFSQSSRVKQQISRQTSANAVAKLTGLPLLGKDSLHYVGGFRVPQGQFGDSSFSFGGDAIAFNPANNSLFVTGHANQRAIAEISIPATLVNSSNRDDLTTATMLQPFKEMASVVPDWSSLNSLSRLGGLMVVDGQLIGTAYEFYDGDYSSTRSHFRLSSLNLATTTGEGLFEVGTLNAGFVAGYMTPVPLEWQADFGAPYLTGQSALSVGARTSQGPAAFGFDPNDFGSGTAPVIPYLYYSRPNRVTLGFDTPVYNGTTQITGAFFAPNTRSYLVFGSSGQTTVGYGDPAAFNDPYRRAKTYHAQDGAYANQVWAYDVLDLLSVKNGEKQPWDILPYAVWTYDFPVIEGSKDPPGGTTFDASHGRLFVSQPKGAGYAYPLIHVFRVPTTTGNSTKRSQR